MPKNRNQLKNKCIVCEEKILPDESLFMLASDYPYKNIYVHRICFHLKSDDEIQKIIENNLKTSLIGYL
jgi:hypothetical protein